MSQRQTRLQGLQNQIRRLEGRLMDLRRRSDRYSQLRLIFFLLATLLSGAIFFLWGAWQWAVALAPLFTPFVVMVYVHRQIDESVTRHQIWLRLKVTHVARMTLDWEHIPATLPIPSRLEHPFAFDLDLIGERSLHQLLDTAVSQEGSRRLRDWLLDTAVDPAHLAERKARVQELCRLPLFRDKLLLNASLVMTLQDEKWVGQQLLDWLSSHPASPALERILRLLGLLSLVNVSLLGLNLLGLAPALWPFSWLLYGAVFLTQMRETGSLFRDALLLADNLEKLDKVFHFLETYRYGRNRRLMALCAPFLDRDNRPSHHLQQVRRMVTAAGLQQHPLMGLLLNLFVPWNYYFAYRMDQCKRDLSTLLPTWLDTWFELEALNSLAAFAYLNPDYVLPELLGDMAVFEAQQLGHPLIGAEERVGNDFSVKGLGSVAIITGSNMAGKSSFLRALGVNLCLAYAGGPVVATTLRISHFRLFTSIRVADSVTDGFSFFYAEVRRLKALLDELQRPHERPLFFLIDEIFRGTNNRERLVGSRDYICALVGGNGTGAIATHDLELVKLADDLPLITNYHFRDAVEDGRMVFDYQLRPGPCPTTNALKIMQLAGLPVKSGE